MTSVTYNIENLIRFFFTFFPSWYVFILLALSLYSLLFFFLPLDFQLGSEDVYEIIFSNFPGPIKFCPACVQHSNSLYNNYFTAIIYMYLIE